MWKNTSRSILKQKTKEKATDELLSVAPKTGNGVDFILPGGLGAGFSAEGPDISEITYFTVLRILSETVGKLPIHVRNKKHEIIDNKVERLLNVRPNKTMTPVQLFSYLEYCRVHYGNGYAYVQWSPVTGEIEAISALDPRQVRIWVDDTGTELVPEYYYSYTTMSGQTYFIASEDIIHVRNWHIDDHTRMVGLPVRTTLQEYMSAAKSGQATQNSLYKNGMISSGVLNYAGDLSDEKQQTLLEKLRQLGTKNKIIPLPKEWELKPINLSLNDAQYLETRRFTATQIAGAFGVSPTQINDYSRGSYSNAVAQQVSFLQDALLYISRQYEDELSVKLLTSDELKSGARIDMDTEAILRSTPEALASTLQKLVTGSIMKINEARDMAGLPPIEGGDKLMTMPGATPIEKEVVVEG